MPAYTYACRLGHTDEHLVPIAQRDDPQTCPICGGTSTRQMEWRIAHRMRKRGVMHIPGYQPARLSNEDVARIKRKDNPWQS